MKNIILVRHGQTDMHAQGIMIDGHSLREPLNESGFKQANRLGVRLRVEGYCFSYLATSPALCAQQTMESILHGMPSHRGATAIFLAKHRIPTSLNTSGQEPHVLRDLIELDQGKWEGKLREEVYSEKVRREMRESHGTFAPPKGESMNDVGERMLKALRVAEKATPEHGHALLVTHKNAIRCLLREILDLDAITAAMMEVEYTSITEIVYTEKRFILRRYNDAAHIIDVPMLK